MAKGGMNNMMKQVQQMQAKMEKMQAELEEMEIEASSGGGMVTVVVNGSRMLFQSSLIRKLSIKKISKCCRI